MTTTARQRRAAAVAALTLAGCALTGTPAVAATNGDVKIHAQYEPTAEQDNDPHVCRFYLDAFNFDAGEEVHWTIAAQPPSTGGTVKEGDLTVTAAGGGSTEVISLPNGHYKLTWATGDGDGQNRNKVFWVECPPRGPHGGPHGGPPAGGGGIARDQAFAPVAGAAAVGMAAVGGVVWFRLRRRPHGA
ncbi:hypothetical protein QF037_007376 [Streptomyces canus]|uniref:hypothetical protein n=1 Tax=Streptomyces canus TaxID=58343 RepID=UPI00278196FF|nr:hypothetical protein [Streptomyces canus]MDQ0603031.1 hypothetical protein [Streptomyces canus]